MRKSSTKVLAPAASLTPSETGEEACPEPPNRRAERLAEQAGVYPVPNLAVEICCKMYLETKQQWIAEGKSPQSAARTGNLAYRSAMPKLSGEENIRDFIACVAHGMLMGILPGAEGARLLYAAQVAFAALPSPKRPRKRRKTAQKRQSDSPVKSKESAN